MRGTPLLPPGLAVPALAAALALHLIALFSVFAPTPGGGSALLWGLSRGTGVLAYGALALAMALGLMVSFRGLTGALEQRRIYRLHEQLAVVVVLATVVHALAAIGLELIEGGVIHPLAGTLGVLGLAGALLLWAQGALMRRLPAQRARIIHRAAYAIFLGALGHAALAGPGVVEAPVRWLYLLVGSALAGAALFRFLFKALDSALAAEPESREPGAAIDDDAVLDQLTGLPLRDSFDDRLQAAIKRARAHREPVVVLYVAIDYEATAGAQNGAHAASDAMRDGAARIQAIVRGRDLLARMGEDEFAIVSEGATAGRNAEQVAERMLEAVAAPSGSDSDTPALAASVGVAVYPNDGWEAESLVQSATMAMYRARVEGGNTFYRYSTRHGAA